MSNSSLILDDSLKTGRLIFFAMLRPLATLLVLMSFLRFLFYWKAQHLFVDVSMDEFLRAFAMGVRFDLLVLGFLMIPAVIWILAMSWLKAWSKIVRLVLKIYGIIFWTFIVGISFYDLRFFAQSGRHITVFDGGVSPFSTGGIFDLLVLLMILLAGVGSFLVLKWPEDVRENVEEPVLRRIVTTLVPIILVAFASRGTVTAHHLERAHSEVSERPVVNELVVNSPWAYSKKPTEN